MVAAQPLPLIQGPRAFRVLHGGRLLGFLGEGPGAFESARGASLLGPPTCHFRSLCASSEEAVLELLHAALDFEVLLQVLHRAGLELRATPSAGLFAESAVIFRGLADVRRSEEAFEVDDCDPFEEAERGQWLAAELSRPVVVVDRP